MKLTGKRIIQDIPDPRLIFYIILIPFAQLKRGIVVAERGRYKAGFQHTNSARNGREKNSAGVVELVYTQDLKSCPRKGLRVRVPPPALFARGAVSRSLLKKIAPSTPYQ